MRMLIVVILVVGTLSCAEKNPWSCDVTFTTALPNHTATGSGEGKTQEDALNKALSEACKELPLDADQESKCRQTDFDNNQTVSWWHGISLNGRFSCKFEEKTNPVAVKF